MFQMHRKKNKVALFESKIVIYTSQFVEEEDFAIGMVKACAEAVPSVTSNIIIFAACWRRKLLRYQIACSTNQARCNAIQFP